MKSAAPDFVWGKGPLREVCKKVFSYPADAYDLKAYEDILPGSAERIWNMVRDEAKRQGIEFKQ